MEGIVIVGEAVAGRTATVRKNLSELVTNIKKHNFDLAVLLAEAANNNYYQQWGYHTIEEYATKELELKPRKTEYLIRISNICQQAGVKRADYEPAGVSKLREITTLNPLGNFYNTVSGENEPLVEHIVRLIAEAPELTFIQVEEEVARLKGQVDENQMVLRNYKVTQSAEKNTIEPAIELARKRLGTAKVDATGKAVEYSKGVCLEMICAEFLADPNNYSEDEMEETNVDQLPNNDNVAAVEGKENKLGGQQAPTENSEAEGII